MPAARKRRPRYRVRQSRADGVAERAAETYTANPAPQPEWVEVAANGRVVIPISFRRALGVEGGGPLQIRLEDGVVKLMTREAVVRSVQDFVAQHVKRRGSMVDELIAERRAEARREEEGT